MSNLLEQASLVMIPSGYKEDVVYSEIPIDGAGDLSFTRSSNGTRVNSAGLVEVVAWNLLYDTDTLSSWGLEGGTLTSGQTDPNGGSSALKYVQTTGGLYSGGVSTADVKFAQVWIKSVSGGAITVNISDGAAFFGTFNVTGTWQLFTAPYTANSRNGLYLYAISNAQGIYVWHPQLNIGATAKPYFPTTDRLNVPRLTYQNGGGGCPSLLLEKQSTNYLLYSQAFTNTWTTYYGTTTDNQTISPDGTQNASKVIMGSGDQAVLRQSIGGLTNGSPYTFSLYIKQGSGVTAFLDISDTASTVNITPTSEWVCYTYTANWSTTNNFIDIELRGTSGVAYCYIWGAQLEAGSYATSLINTTSSSATRVADACSKTGISSLIGQTQGVLFVDLVITGTTGNNRFSISDGSNTNWIFIGTPEDGATGSSRFYIKTNGVVHVDTGTSSYFTIGQRYKLALAYKSGDWAVYANGSLLYSGTDSIASVSSALSQFNFFNASGGTADTGEQINQAILFPTRLTNAELASLTTI